MALSEFDLINRFFSQQTIRRDDVLLGIGDDAALLMPPAGKALVVAVDTLVEGVHFPASVSAEDIGYRVLAVNLSDFAAMGAEPAWATLALTLPSSEEAWLKDFCKGLFDLAASSGVQVVGGDTTRGSLTVTLQLHGWVEPPLALRRAGAQVGDLICVTGTIGDAGAGLAIVQQEQDLAAEERRALRARFLRPTPRVGFGQALRGLATAAIDISDGLLADLGHILAASGVGGCLDAYAIPLSTAFRRFHAQGASDMAVDVSRRVPWSGYLTCAVTAGDDYELCFTVPAQRRGELMRRAQHLDVGVTVIGVVEPQKGLRMRADEHVVTCGTDGYQHFRGS